LRPLAIATGLKQKDPAFSPVGLRMMVFPFPLDSSVLFVIRGKRKGLGDLLWFLEEVGIALVATDSVMVLVLAMALEYE